MTGSRGWWEREPSGHVLRCAYPEEGPGAPGGSRGEADSLRPRQTCRRRGQLSSWAGGLPNTTSSICPGAIHITCHVCLDTGQEAPNQKTLPEGSSGEAKEGPPGRTLLEQDHRTVGNRPTEGEGRSGHDDARLCSAPGDAAAPSEPGGGEVPGALRTMQLPTCQV